MAARYDEAAQAVSNIISREDEIFRALGTGRGFQAAPPDRQRELDNGMHQLDPSLPLAQLFLRSILPWNTI